MPRALNPCFVAAFLVLATVAPSFAQIPASPAPAAAATPRDSTRAFGHRLHPWVEFGGGWMSGPARLSRHYQASQGLAAGLEARPAPRWALRGALDYQMLIANSQTPVYILNAAGTGVDTGQVQTQTTGWIAGARAEAGARLGADFWLTAGAGGGYMHSGLSGVETDVLTGYQVLPSDLVANGWGWSWTAAVRYDFTPDPRVPGGVAVRTSSLQRRHDSVQTWSVRLCYRIPEGRPHGAPRRRHR